MLAQERAQESERLTEEVTRHMPTGLLLVNATGAITSANPAAEDALSMRPMRYRSYREILGTDSGLAQMLTACLRDGKTFQRGEVEHVTDDGEVRRLGVTISPIYRPTREVRTYVSDPASGSKLKVSGALCLMSDLTELTALQKQIRWKEKSGRSRRNVRGHRARVQECAGNNFRVRADDPQRSGSGRYTRFSRAYSGSDSFADTRGDRIPALRQTPRNLV